MAQPGHSLTVVIDKGASTPVDIAHGTLFPIPVATAIPIAEFGLAVEQGTVFNFVTLTGTVGVASTLLTQSTSIEKVVLRVVRTNTGPVSAPVTIFETHQSLLGFLQEVSIGFSFTDGGIDGAIPTGYYSYVLTIQRETNAVAVDVFEPVVIGPIQFEGTSYTTNTGLVGLN